MEKWYHHRMLLGGVQYVIARTFTRLLARVKGVIISKYNCNCNILSYPHIYLILVAFDHYLAINDQTFSRVHIFVPKQAYQVR